MRIKVVLNVLGILWVFYGLFMMSSCLFSLYYQAPDLGALFICAAGTMLLGGLVFLVTRGEKQLRLREAFAIVSGGWLSCALLGALPFLACGTYGGITDAFFETMSGLTTTGASITTNIEALPQGILYWRSMTHWLGGMGIIVLSLAVLPAFGIGGIQMMGAEAPGLEFDRISARLTNTAKILWGIYLLLTVLETGLLWAGGQSLHEALCHAFGTMATGGFSVKNASIGHYGSAYYEWVIIFFMACAGTNFSLHFFLLRGRPGSYWQSGEFRFYLGAMVLCWLLMAGALLARGEYGTMHELLRSTGFQAVSITTTTGYVSADFERWPAFCQMILMTLMFFGGCAGSTGGGMKQVRILLLLKMGYSRLIKLIHPRAVLPLRVGNQVISGDKQRLVLEFFVVFMALVAFGSLVLTAMGLDILTAFTGTVSAICNIGPALGSLGPYDNYAHLPAGAKWFLSFYMLLGRLEVFTFLILFMPPFWRK